MFRTLALKSVVSYLRYQRIEISPYNLSVAPGVPARKQKQAPINIYFFKARTVYVCEMEYKKGTDQKNDTGEKGQPFETQKRSF